MSFDVENHSTLAVIGDSYSGKSLLGKVLSGSIDFKTGRITYSHYNLVNSPQRSKAFFGYLPRPISIDRSLTGYEFLELIGSIYQIKPDARQKRIAELAAAFRVEDEIHFLLENSLPSTQKKIALMSALIHQPKLLILNEPLEEIDFIDRASVTEYLRDYTQNDRSIILITDDPNLIEEIADDCLLLDGGRLVFNGSKKQLAHQSGLTKPRIVDAARQLLGR